MIAHTSGDAKRRAAHERDVASHGNCQGGQPVAGAEETPISHEIGVLDRDFHRLAGRRLPDWGVADWIRAARVVD